MEKIFQNGCVKIERRKFNPKFDIGKVSSGLKLGESFNPLQQLAAGIFTCPPLEQIYKRILQKF
ncbi:MAG: hypothetical protein ABIJ40_00305 [Bacteroidota bacterium]